MTTLIASHSSALAGAERSLLDTLESALRVTDLSDVVVVLPDHGPLGERLQEDFPAVQVKRVACRQWMGRRNYGIVGLIRLIQCAMDIVRFYRIYGQISVDRVIANTSTIPAPILAARLRRIPSMVVARESLRTNPTLRSLLPKSWIIAILKHCATQVASVSQYIDSQWGGGTLIPPKAQITRSATVPHLAGDLDVAAGPLKLVMLGSFSAEKGQADAIRAAGLLQQRGVQIQLSLAGQSTDTYQAELGRLIDALELRDVVSMLQPVPDPIIEFEKHDVALVCSRNEAFGRVTVEAIEAGIPVVGYDAGGTREILLETGGVLVPPNVESLATALSHLVEEPDTLAAARFNVESILEYNWRQAQTFHLVQFIANPGIH